MQRKIVKTLQPNYREFDDNRHFYDNRKLCFDQILKHNFSNPSIDMLDQIDIFLSLNSQIKINNHRLGFVICEDSWQNDYTVSPIDTVNRICKKVDSKNKMDLLINISCSPYTQGKNNKRNRVFGNHAKRINAPIVYVNNVGVQNNGKTIYSFDGNSCIYDKSGNQINPYKPFQEGCETIEVDLDEDFGDTGYAPQDDIKMVYDAIVYTTKEYMNEMSIKKVVIGASGGIDSAVVAALMSKILPARDILLVNMPSKYNSKTTKDAAEKLASNIGCPYKVIAIQESVDLTKSQLKKVGLDLNSLAIENIQARDRSARVLAACSSSFGGPFTCNANKSEMTVGYSTMYGDTCGFISPIADLWKGQVYELAKYINKEAGYDLIPKESIEVKPSAELSKEQDVTKFLGDPMNYPYHDKLFASWVERWNRLDPEDILKFYVDGILEQEIEYEGNIRELFRTHREFIDDLERWWNNFAGLSVFKRIIGCPIVGTSRRICGGFDMRESLVKYSYTKKYSEIKKALLEQEDNYYGLKKALWGQE